MSGRLTERQAIVLTAFTGTSLCPFPHLQRAVEEVLERPVITHEFARHELWDEIRLAFRDEALAMMPEAFTP